MTVFVDTSIVLRVLLGQPNPFREWGCWEEAYVSDLLRLECFRTFDRLSLEGRLDDEKRVHIREQFDHFWSSCSRIPVSQTVLTRAADPFPTVVASLDAIHLSSAILLEPVLGVTPVFLTHDVQLARAARAMGLDVRPS